MKIAVIGAGHLGYSLAAYLTLQKHEVSLYEQPSSGKNLDPVLERGGIELSRIAGEGFAKISKVTTDMEEAIRDVKTIMLCTTSNAHKTIGELCAPLLEDGQIILLIPGNAGSLDVAKILNDKHVKPKDKNIKIVDTSCPFGCRRVIGQAQAKVMLLNEVKLAAFPAADTRKVIEDLKGVFDFKTGESVIEIGLSNPNIMCHVAGAILNTGYIEASGGNFYLYKQGMSSSVLKAI